MTNLDRFVIDSHNTLFQMPKDTAPVSYLLKRKIAQRDVRVWLLGYGYVNSSLGYRIIIPIRDMQNRVVSASCRSLSEGSLSKYWHFPFDKRFHLHGLLENLGMIQNAGVAILVESYFDTIHLWRWGFPSVDMMGSSLSIEQAALLSRYAQSVVYVPHANKTAPADMDKVLGPLQAVNLPHFVHYLPEGFGDFGDLAEKGDPTAWLASLQSSLHQYTAPSEEPSLSSALRSVMRRWQEDRGDVAGTPPRDRPTPQ